MNYLSSLQTLITYLILFVTAGSAFSQSAQTEIEIIQEAFGLEKKVAVANFMDLGEAAESFWKIYDEYEAKRKELGKERIKVIADYANSYPAISDEEILALFKRTKAFKKSFAKLQQTYFNRMRKEVGTSVAAQFWQLESYFNAMIQAEIYSQIPFIGENLDGN
jgi:hypothetical protein